MPNRAAIYCRLSYSPDGDLEKVERQEADCRAMAARLGWEIAPTIWQDGAPPGVLRDNARSAWQRGRKRPGWDRLLEIVRDREVDGVIVWHGDRLIRQPWDLEVLLRLTEEYALPLASVSGVRNLSSADDRFILRIEAAQACKSSDDTSRRVRRGWAARAKAGRPSGGGKRPFGFADLETRDPRESALLAEAARRRLAGQSHGSVVRWLNERATTTSGGPFTGTSLSKLFRSPRIAGLVEHEGTLYEAMWKPIISVEEWQALTALLSESAASHPAPGRERKYLLTGIAECVSCGQRRIRTKPSGGRNRKTARLYHCANPDCTARVSRNQHHLDEYVTGRVIRRLGDRRLLERLKVERTDPTLGEEITALEGRRAETVQQLEQLADHPELSIDLAARALRSFDERLAALRARAATSARARLLARHAGITRAAWDDLPIDVCAELVRATYRVIILPATWRGPGFDPDSVRLERV